MDPPNTFGNNSKFNYSTVNRNINNSSSNTSKYFTFKTNNVRLNNIPDINGSTSTDPISKFSSNEKNENAVSSSSMAENLKTKLKKSDGSDYRIFTGNAERIIKWNKIYDKFCYYEVISSVISIQEGSVRLQKIMMLKDRKGPILKVVHYIHDHINIDDFYVGQMLRCVGRMIGPNTLHAVSIRAAMPNEVSNLQRLCYICDHTIAKIV